MVAQHCECTKGHRIVHFKMVNCMSRVFNLSLKKSLLRLEVSGWAASPLRVTRGRGGPVRRREVALAQKSHMVAGPGKWRLQERAGLRVAAAARRRHL